MISHEQPSMTLRFARQAGPAPRSDCV